MTYGHGERAVAVARGLWLPLWREKGEKSESREKGERARASPEKARERGPRLSRGLKALALAKARAKARKRFGWPKRELKSFGWPKRELKRFSWPKRELKRFGWPKRELKRFGSRSGQSESARFGLWLPLWLWYGQVRLPQRVPIFLANR